MRHDRWSPIFLILGFISLLGLFGIGYYQQKNDADRVLLSKLKAWHNDLAQSLAERDWIRAAKIGREFSTPGYIAWGFEQNQRIVLSFPAEDSLAKCLSSISSPITLYGVKVGEFRACRSRSLVSLQVLRSPFFLVLAIFVLVVTAIGAVLPLFRYRRGLRQVMSLLEEQVERSTSEIAPIGPGSDEISKRMIEMVNRFSAKQVLLQKELGRLEKDRELAHLAEQTAHDIRSPLSVLNVVAAQMAQQGDQSREIMESVVKRINDIADQLLNRSRVKVSVEKGSRLPVTLESIVQEKQAEYQRHSELKIVFISSLNVPVDVSISEQIFKRSISNLINNSVEALPGGRGLISLKVDMPGDMVNVEIRDNGRGIQPDMIDKVGERGFSANKSDGNGLGIFAAKNAVLGAGGSFKVTSEVGKGTVVQLQLPAVTWPKITTP